MYQPGFKTLGVHTPDSGVRLDLNIWYPTVRRPNLVTYAPWDVLVARQAREVEGRFPLLILSHDSAGTRFSHHETAAFFARCGFVVVAPTHANDNAQQMQHLFTWVQLQHRVEEVRATLDVVLQHPEIHTSIDADRIGIVGFGTGGTAALLLAGALPSAEGWPEYCLRAKTDDPYCSAWVQERMQKLVQHFPLTQSLADTRIKAVALVAPAYGMLFSQKSMAWVYPPTLLIKAGGDSIHRAPFHTDALYAALHATRPASSYFAVIPDVEMSAFVSACPPEFLRDIPEYCDSLSTKARQVVQRQFHALLEQFFVKTLGDIQSVAHIPAPPDLTPPPPKITEKPAQPEKKKGRTRTPSPTQGQGQGQGRSRTQDIER